MSGLASGDFYANLYQKHIGTDMGIDIDICPKGILWNLGFNSNFEIVSLVVARTEHKGAPGYLDIGDADSFSFFRLHVCRILFNRSERFCEWCDFQNSHTVKPHFECFINT